MTSCYNEKNLKQHLRDLNNKDYISLNSFIKNKTVVGIGEHTHGDGKLFELKTEIIEHLHKNLGFEAVLMESDFLSVEKVLPALSTQSIKSAANIGIQSTWADSKEYASFLKYLKSASKKGDTLFFHGFDSQMTGKESLTIHINQAQKIKDKITLLEFNSLINALKVINTRYINDISLDSLLFLKQNITTIKKRKDQLTSKTLRWIKNVEGNLKQFILLKEAPRVTSENLSNIFSHPSYLESGSIRDSLMAQNIRHYLKKYKKVIIWAANYHLQTSSNDRARMGELLKSSFGDNYYSILVLYNQGTWSYPNGEPNGKIPIATQGTLAYEISSTIDSEIAFLDIKSTKLPKIKVRTNNWVTTDSINVGDYCDALLYIRNSMGSTALN